MQPELRIAIVVSHPIQHFCPQYVSFSKKDTIELKVFFASALGYKKYPDANFKKEISWGNLQLEKFDHVFLNGDKVIQATKDIDALSLEQELAAYNPQLVIIYGYFQKLQRRAHRWARNNKKLIAYISDSELRHRRNDFIEWIKFIFLRRYFSAIHYFLSVGDANEAYYKKLSVKNDQLIRMHFPIDLDQYEKSFQQKEQLGKSVRQEYGINGNEIVMIAVGKLAPWKNQDHIIDAMHLLEQEGIYLHLFILGSGEMQGQLGEKSQSLQKSKVHFPGFVDIEKLPAYYAASDMYVHPASVEPHSIAVSEAIYMGCPVIISSRCGSYGDTDDVQEEKNGYVFDFGNIQLLASKIKLLCSDEWTRKKMSSYSHSIAVQFQQRAHGLVMDDLVKKVRAVANREMI